MRCNSRLSRVLYGNSYFQIVQDYVIRLFLGLKIGFESWKWGFLRTQFRLLRANRSSNGKFLYQSKALANTSKIRFNYRGETNLKCTESVNSLIFSVYLRTADTKLESRESSVWQGRYSAWTCHCGEGWSHLTLELGRMSSTWPLPRYMDTFLSLLRVRKLFRMSAFRFSSLSESRRSIKFWRGPNDTSFSSTCLHKTVSGTH
jgi:hypothetical protein